MSATHARAITPQDVPACLALMQGNVPRYFAEREVADFERWPLRRTSPFLVLDDGAQILACGGYEVSAGNGEARLTWGMVKREQQRRGLGSKLLTERLAMITREPGVRAVVLDTSQHSRAFYERHGFRAVAETPDGYGPGLDRIDMRLSV